jgi:hypothetical protein
MSTGQGIVLVVSMYVTLELVTFKFTCVARDDLNFAIAYVNLEKGHDLYHPICFIE